MIKEIDLKQINKKILELIEEEVYEDVYEKTLNLEKDYVELDEVILVFNYEIYYTYTEEYDSEEEEVIETLRIIKIIKYDIEQLLKDRGIKYEKSSRSETIYLNGGDVRISTHSRPGYSLHGSYTKHDYDEEFIFDNEVEMYLGLAEMLENNPEKFS